MKVFAKVIGLVLLAYAGLVYSGWGQKQYWNQKFILEVETPNGVVSSETVLQYRSSDFPKRLNRNNFSRLGLFGEAPFIKLADGKYLFALSLYGIYDVPNAYKQHFGMNENTSSSELFPQIAASSDTVEMLTWHDPIFITFDDINDPSTIRQVRPSFLEGAFGFGYKLKRFDTVVTKEPVTYGRIAKIAKWMIYSNGPFNPSYEGINEEGKDVGNFNCSVLARTINCKIDSFLINNLTYGFRSKGLFCSY